MFARLIAARTLSILGDRISEVAIPLAIVLMHRPVWLVGAVTACLFAPVPLLGLQFGSIADRYSRRSLLMAADGGRVLIYLALGSGVGGLVASLVIARFTERWPWGAALGVSVLASAVGLGVLLIARGFPVAITGAAILDCSSASCFILAISARQAMTPSAVTGRVTASSAMITGAVRGSAAVSFGLLLNYLGATTMIWVLVVITIPAGLWLSLARPGRGGVHSHANIR